MLIIDSDFQTMWLSGIFCRTVVPLVVTSERTSFGAGFFFLFWWGDWGHGVCRRHIRQCSGLIPDCKPPGSLLAGLGDHVGHPGLNLNVLHAVQMPTACTLSPTPTCRNINADFPLFCTASNFPIHCVVVHFDIFLKLGCSFEGRNWATCAQG